MKKMLVPIILLAVQRTPAILKQLRIWHLGYLDRKPNNKK
ncbi:hypothetical protein [Staphylococcus massiliensis]|uniref:Uncharacterized protein n=1 Tax=Staphylococcus massiliensis S46 TaxID=1229783 RepID=K9B962_9STAP|nr:hypothetical protein [Staphylococcus massiliensis]EKU50305.1 hypothetical protein C273_01645 [Staphylococcus massiliensis S46]